MASPVCANVCSYLVQAIATDNLQIFEDTEWVGDIPTGLQRST